MNLSWKGLKEDSSFILVCLLMAGGLLTSITIFLHLWWVNGGMGLLDRVEHSLAVPIDILAIVSLVSAIGSNFDSKIIRKKTERMISLLPTKEVGPFPQHLEDIRILVGQATTSLDIMLDCADYGSFYDPQRYIDFEEALARVSRDVTIRILVYGHLNVFTARSQFYGKPFAAFFQDPIFKNDFQRYRESWKVNKKLFDLLERLADAKGRSWEIDKFAGWLREYGPQEYVDRIPTADSLLELVKSAVALCKNNEDLRNENEWAFRTLMYLREFAAEGNIRSILESNREGSGLRRSKDAKSPAFVWIRDIEKSGVGPQGIFIIPDLDQRESRGTAFTTSDRDLLRIFYEPFCVKWGKSEYE